MKDELPIPGSTPGSTPGSPQAPSRPGFADVALDRVKGFGLRIFVHALAIICAVAGTGGSAPFSRVAAVLCMYVGLICLVARGTSLRPAWLLPALAGILQALLLLLGGFPPYQAVFWGGAQSWLQRLLRKKGDMGGEFAPLLLLLPLGIMLVNSFSFPAFLAASFGCIVLAGAAASSLGGRLFSFFRRRHAEQGLAPAERTVAFFRASVKTLTEKCALLPADVQPTVRAIAAVSEEILRCMAKDPRDLEPGRRFLKRYLGAAHSVADTHLRLARERVITPEMAEALARSGEMLTRLERAFSQEHSRLLQNDVSDFSADLKVLDTLLKMDGHEKAARDE